jgi:uncharacterized membrane protein (DUF4010 family)
VNASPSIFGFALLLGLSFFLGLAFEDVFARAGTRRPGGIRTFPALAITGGMLYVFDPARFIPFSVGLLVLGAWLLVYYREHIHEPDEEGRPNIGLMVPLLNVFAYTLGPIALALPHWIAVGTTVAAVLIFTARGSLHELARRIEIREIITAGEFLILTGLVLPLLPDRSVTSLTAITPHQAWLALVVVSAISYASYLSQRYLSIPSGGLWMAALSGLYSSTATTVVLARQIKSNPQISHQALAGITLATAVMYLRILVIVGIFNLPLAFRLMPALMVLAIVGLGISAIQYRKGQTADQPLGKPNNPLEIGTAVIFTLLFIVTSLGATFATGHFGVTGIYSLAGVIGVTDIDPFVLNLAQGGPAGLPVSAMATAILIAMSSNNLMKAVYTILFAGWRKSIGATAGLVALGAVGGLWAVLMTGPQPLF